MQKEKIVKTCREAWINSGRGRLLLAVSGGADSTALLLAFSQARIPIDVAHCNFNLRGEESLRDRDFVAALCNRMGVTLHTVDFNTPRETLKGESLEMTCRRLRYEFFRRLMEENGFARVVVAHNADDNAETFFLNALRGSGTKGLAGMEADTGEILRPLLYFRRAELVDFLERNGQAYVTDSSNLESKYYRRNFLRNVIFPHLEARWKGFHTAIATTIDIQRREHRIIEHFVDHALKGVSELLPWNVLLDFPDAETLVYRFISPYGGTPAIAREMARNATSSSPDKIGKRWCLNKGITALTTRHGIRIETSSKTPSAVAYKWERMPDIPDIATLKSAPLSEAYLPYGEDRYEWVEADREMKIKSLGLKGSQSVWKVLKDVGLSPAEREACLVLVDKETGEPIWLPGIKRSRLHLLSPDSPTAYRVS